MERYVIFVVLSFASFFGQSLLIKQYRKDYDYNPKTDAFYKLHIETKVFWVAKEICAVEGGELMVPESKEDVIQVHGMMKRFPDIGDHVLVATDGREHETAEENSIVYLEPTTTERFQMMPGEKWFDVVTRDGEIQSYFTLPPSLPFVCKVAVSDAPYDDRCGVYSFGYIHFDTVGSCYKIPKGAYTWDAAFAECQAQGAHLVVLNSQREHDAVWDLVRATELDISSSYDANFLFFAGIRADRNTDGKKRVWRTVLNGTLSDSGYDRWSEDEPSYHMGLDYCGAIVKSDGNYIDVDCTNIFAFICEKEVM